MYTLRLGLSSGFIVAFATVDWSAFAWLEGDFAFLTTFGTYGGEHLALWSVAVALSTEALCFPGFATGRAAPRLVGIAFGLEEFLFLSAEAEGSSAVGALEFFVLKTHWMTSSVCSLAVALVIQCVGQTGHCNW